MVSVKPILWSYPEDHSVEHFSLVKELDHYLLKGTVICLLKGEATYIKYAIRCTASWKTLSVVINQQWANTEKTIAIVIDDKQHWKLNGEPVTFANGLHDVDLEITPATNTLPICRLALAPRESEDVTAVWVRFPELTLEPLHQRYTRVSADEYIYDSLISGFRASLNVDTDGVVIQYGDLWKRIP